MSLHLVCDGSRAESGSSLQQQKRKSLIRELSQSATLFSRDVACLQDGEHEASYIGHDAQRDVYRVGDVIMKLATVATEEQLSSNSLEAEALKGQKLLNKRRACSFKGCAL
jgi:hypothetical protein